MAAILCPKTISQPGTKKIYRPTLEATLNACHREGYRPAFMSEIVDRRINSVHNDEINYNGYLTLSLKAIGRTISSNVSVKGGTPIAIYAHIPHYFSNPRNILKARQKGLVNRVGRLPEKEFLRLEKLQDGENVFVVDYQVLKNSAQQSDNIDDALAHPQTIPFLGGKERAELYLKKSQSFSELNGYFTSEDHSLCINNLHRDDDLATEPLGRLLYINYMGDYEMLFENDFSNPPISGIYGLSRPSKAQKSSE